ncbi:MAG: thioredoxin domain-containing protein [Chloroflexi bacterium]|nr:thioredoxin domain-containing protein [Chloroflexota bacterium]
MADLRFSPRPHRAHLVRWQEWSDAAFAEARAQDKPMLLAIAAAWCHWCHVMDETTYSDDAVIQTLNQDFIPVRVDSDRRPDINRRYNRGGWPTTAILTPEGDLLAGDTYIEPERMRSFLAQVRDYYWEHKGEIRQKAAALLAQRSAALGRTPEPVPAATEVVAAVLADLRERFDRVHGGVGAAPKFPAPAVHDLLLYRSLTADDQTAREMLTTTLDRMRQGGILDQEEGGFFRYSAASTWDAPHYEKLLENNALLLANYLVAAHLLEVPEYRDTARHVLAYLERTLLDPETGALYGSQDADETYYRLPLAARRQHTPPAVDRTIYAHGNGLAASALVLASWVLEAPEHLDRAGRILDFLWERMRDPAGLLYHAYYDGEARGPVLLTDQLPVGLALLDLYEATGRSEVLARATALATAVVQGFRDPEAGGFWDLRQPQQGQGSLALRDKLPEDQARAAEFFQRLSLATGEPRYHDLALEALRAGALGARAHPLAAAAYALASLRVQDEPLHIVIPGNPDDPRTQALLAAGLRLRHPHRLVQALDPQEDADLLDALGYVAGPSPLAYVCYQMACSPPLQDPAAIPQAVARLSQASSLAAMPSAGPGGGITRLPGSAAMPFVTLTPPARKEPEE